LSRKIVQAHADAIPIVAVIGAREAVDGSVVLRDRAGGQRILSVAAAIALLRAELAVPVPVLNGTDAARAKPIAAASDDVATKIAIGGYDDVWC
jgi:hypothetical protein